MCSREHVQGGGGVPIARSVNPITGADWEGVNVEPDIRMPADAALDFVYQHALTGTYVEATSKIG
jgi:hypothetical protein